MALALFILFTEDNMRTHSERVPLVTKIDAMRAIDPDLFDEEEIDSIDEEVVQLCEHMRELEDA